MLLRFNNKTHKIQNVFSRGLASQYKYCYLLHILCTNLLQTINKVDNRVYKPIYTDMSTLKQRFGLYYAVYVLSDTLSAD
jgi:hypothetical protein